jgi:apolipoprotein N-acyltransferase
VPTFPRTRASFPKADAASWWGAILAGLAYSLLTSLSLPPIDFWPLAFAAIVPLLWAGCRIKRPVLGALLVGLGTLPMWFFQQAWLINVSAPGYPFLCLYLAAYPTVFVWIIAQLRRVDWPIPTSLIAAITWTALEVVRGEIIFDGYAWFQVGHPLIASPFLSNPAALLGAYTISFLVAALSGAVADAAGWAGINRQQGGIGALVIALFWLTLSLIARPSAESAEARDFRVGVVQTNLPQDNKMSWPIAERVKDFNRFKDLTRTAAAVEPKPDLIVWPETMFPGRALNPEAVKAERDLGVHFLLPRTPDQSEPARVDADRFANELQQLQRQLATPMLVGAIGIDGDYTAYLREVLSSDSPRKPLTPIRRYNSSFVISGGLVTDRYDKAELTPFGEFIPYVWRWPSLQQMVLDLGAQGMAFDLAMGRRIGGVTIPPPVASSRSIRVATPICFEGTKSDLCRRLVIGADAAGRASAIVNMSNDGWFSWWDGGREQHLLASRWRCVELRVPMIRCVNTGVSCLIDRTGRITNDRLIDRPENTRRADGVLVGSVRVDPSRPRTLFERLGMLPAYTLTLLATLLTLTLWIRRRRALVMTV